MQLTWTPLQITIARAVYHSLPDYSAVVFFGGKRKDGTTMPSREWMTTAIGLVDFEREFKKAFEETKSIDEAFKRVSQVFYDKQRELMKDPMWEWDRTTRRKSGAVVSSPRDLIDLGNLYNEQTLTFE